MILQRFSGREETCKCCERDSVHIAHLTFAHFNLALRWLATAVEHNAIHCLSRSICQGHFTPDRTGASFLPEPLRRVNILSTFLTFAFCRRWLYLFIIDVWFNAMCIFRGKNLFVQACSLEDWLSLVMNALKNVIVCCERETHPVNHEWTVLRSRDSRCGHMLRSLWRTTRFLETQLNFLNKVKKT